MIIGRLNAVGGGMDMLALKNLVMGVLILAKREGGDPDGVVEGTNGVVGGTGDSSDLALAAKSPTVLPHSHFSHGQTQPSSSHGHLFVSMKAVNVRIPMTNIVAHVNPMIALVSC
jgi:hypothetical protein